MSHENGRMTVVSYQFVVSVSAEERERQTDRQTDRQ